jgi:hypothetical protein
VDEKLLDQFGRHDEGDEEPGKVEQVTVQNEVGERP